jgi:hypothetical protein
MSKSDLENRAMAAYFRSANQLGGSAIQPGRPEEIEVDGLRYIVLSNGGGILTVYRVRIVNGVEVLKGLKRWPKEIDRRY